VCGAGNGGWTSELESTLIPILTDPVLGHSAVLTTDQQVDVATWACMKAMLFEYALPAPPVFTQADREILMTQRDQGVDGRVSVQSTIRRRSANSHSPSCFTNSSR
jgi:hypothetical protein